MGAIESIIVSACGKAAGSLLAKYAMPDARRAFRQVFSVWQQRVPGDDEARALAFERFFDRGAVEAEFQKVLRDRTKFCLDEPRGGG